MRVRISTALVLSMEVTLHYATDSIFKQAINLSSRAPTRNIAKLQQLQRFFQQRSMPRKACQTPVVGIEQCGAEFVGERHLKLVVAGPLGAHGLDDIFDQTPEG